MAQLVKNMPAMWETWVQSLGWEDPLEKGETTHSSILAWRIPWTVGCPLSRTRLSNFHFTFSPACMLHNDKMGFINIYFKTCYSVILLL